VRAVLYWILKYIILGPILRLIYRPKTRGVENIPRSEPVILAINHLSFVDSLFVPLMVRRKVVYLGKSDYFDKWYTAWFVRAAGVIPVRREGGEAGEAALRAGVSALGQGYAVGIYPEGTRSPDGRLYRGKTGVARMALEAQAKVVPVAVFGTPDVMPIDAKFPKLHGPVEIHFGKPLSFERFYGRAGDRFVLRSVTDEVMYEIMMLTGQEYVDEYASKVKEEIAAERRARERESVGTGT
jgi:1-acyl-sn-glycerol-3-phosphate acyltransferase